MSTEGTSSSRAPNSPLCGRRSGVYYDTAYLPTTSEFIRVSVPCMHCVYTYLYSSYNDS